ncbi:MAG TPA: PD-(D/E)XK nuclease family protein, partial [Candidatus Babeliaceae bacterium]|nr:PD-(D/E)XK nuclease family protein [Candidatus Babeliaceae bacterium]
ALLEQINVLNNKYEKITQLSGESFNVFRILKLHASEVHLHSLFLAELLNPTGTHGYGDIFLKLFIERFKYLDRCFQTHDAVVKVEKYIGLINEDRTQGGRIDIVITDKNNQHIIIENKIYAEDQINQLQRYKWYSSLSELFYLTLDGRKASEFTKGALVEGNDFKLLSYKIDILRWLEVCRKETVTQPIIRETITQYINLIKSLTGQTINDTMQEELSTIVLSNLESAFMISNNLDIITNRLLNNLKAYALEIEDEFKEKGVKLDYYVDINEKYTGFFYIIPNWNYLNIGFQFQEYFTSFIYGLCRLQDPNETLLPLEIKERVDSLSGMVSKPNAWWPIQFYLESPYDKNWNTAFEPWQALHDGSFKDVIRRKLTHMLNLTNGLEF